MSRPFYIGFLSLCALAATSAYAQQAGSSVGASTRSDQQEAANVDLVLGLPVQPDQIRTNKFELKLQAGAFTNADSAVRGARVGVSGHLDVTVNRSTVSEDISESEFASQWRNGGYAKLKYLAPNAKTAPEFLAALRSSNDPEAVTALKSVYAQEDGKDYVRQRHTIAAASVNFMPQGRADINLNDPGQKSLNAMQLELLRTDLGRARWESYRVERTGGALLARTSPGFTADFSMISAALVANMNETLKTQEKGVSMDAFSFSIHDVGPQSPEVCLHAQPIRFIVGETKIGEHTSPALVGGKVGACLGVSFGDKVFKLVLDSDFEVNWMINNGPSSGSDAPWTMAISNSLSVKDIGGKDYLNISAGHTYEKSVDGSGQGISNNRFGLTVSVPIR